MVFRGVSIISAAAVREVRRRPWVGGWAGLLEVEVVMREREDLAGKNRVGGCDGFEGVEKGERND